MHGHSNIKLDKTSLDCRVSLKYTDTDRKKLITTRVFITRTCLEAYWQLLPNKKFQITPSAGAMHYIF